MDHLPALLPIYDDNPPLRQLLRQETAAQAQAQLRRRHVRLSQVAQAARLLLVGDVWSTGGSEHDLRIEREQILAGLEVNQSLFSFAVDHHILQNLCLGDQSRLFRALENIPTLQILAVQGNGNVGSHDKRLRLFALSKSLPKIVANGLSCLTITDIDLCGNATDLEHLVEAVGTVGFMLESLFLKGIHVRVRENMEGFLDPVLRAMHSSEDADGHGPTTATRQQPTRFGLSGGDSNSHPSEIGPSLVSTRALRLYLTSTATFTSTLPRFLGLSHLGLGDDHCKIIATLFVKNDRAPVGVVTNFGDFLPGGAVFGELDLSGNCNIGQEGYEAILGLLNREHWIGKVAVDDVSWQAKFGLIADMNTKHGRGAFLQDGVFESKAAWVDWIARLAALDDEKNAKAKVDDARQLGFLLYTLTEKPEFLSR
jgi:hypothetical protein